MCQRQYTVLVNADRITAIDASALPWEERWNEHLGKMLYRKNLVEDPETGSEIRIVRYPAGVINTRHVHTCAHGMYVLKGTLVTHAGQFGPGHFVWFPAGIEMEHGAAAEADVTVLFITNRKFDIEYLPKNAAQPA
jgi:quercetin dioxygenase-like cupin family protein